MTKLEDLNEKLDEQLLKGVLLPTLLFWTGGLAAAWLRGAGPQLEVFAKQMHGWGGTTAIVLALVVMLLTGAVVTFLQAGALSLFEGHWLAGRTGTGWLARRLTARWASANDAVNLQDPQGPQDNVRTRVARGVAEQVAHESPGNPDLHGPTRVGNMLQATVARVAGKYGLDVAVCWPRLWLLIPDGTRTEVEAAQAGMDDALRGFVYSLLFSVWAWPCWGSAGDWRHLWPLAVSLAGMVVYRSKLFVAASRYTDSVEAVFDDYRLELYRAAGWQVPDRLTEPEVGAKLTMFLWRGL